MQGNSFRKPAKMSNNYPFDFLVCYRWRKVPEKDGLRLVKRTRLCFSRWSFVAITSCRHHA